MKHTKLATLLTAFLLSLFMVQPASANSAARILDQEVNAAIAKFKQEVQGGANFLPKAKGYLVFPSIIKAGLYIGGQYGKGALRIDGETKAYYSMTAASIGLQAGAQQHAMIIAFLTEGAMHSFLNSNGWEAGVDGSIAVADWGKGKDIGSISFEKPIIAFIYDVKGLMASVSVAGTKFQRITP